MRIKKVILVVIAALFGPAFATTNGTVRDMVQLDDSGVLKDKVYNLTLSNSNNSTDYHLTGSNHAIQFTVPSVSGDAMISSYMMTFSFDKLPNLNKDACIRTQPYNDTASLSVCSLVSSTGTSPLLSFTRGDSSASAFGGTLVGNTTDTFAITVYTTLNAHTLYLSNLTTGEYVRVQNNDIPTEITKFDFISKKAHAYSASGAINLFVGEVADISGLTQSQVNNLVKTGSPTPEPTTATLSLLALVGLCARRRRRK